MNLYWLRIELSDDPGCLGDVANALGSLGVNILELDLQMLDACSRADDLLVDLPNGVNLPSVAAVLAPARCRLVTSRQAETNELVDPVARGLQLATSLAQGDPSAERVAEVVCRLVRADQAWVCDETALEGGGVMESAFTRRAVVHGQEPVKLFGRRTRLAWVLAVPFELEGSAQVVMVARQQLSFTATERARVQSLLQLADHRSRTPVPPSSGATTWSGVTTWEAAPAER